MSLRKAINDHCASCVYDKCSPGTRLQQITLCSVESCSLWPVRPKTAHTIPESVIVSYGAKKGLYQASEGGAS